MYKNKYSISELLNKLDTGELNRCETNVIVERSYQIAISFLKTKYSSNLASLLKNGDKPEDIAMDAIVPLFTINSSGELGLKTSLKNWNDVIDNEIDADFFLSRIVWRRVDQTVTHIYKDNDPVFEKIMKSLKNCINNNYFKKVRYFGTVYILEDETSKIYGKVITEKDFNNIPEKYFNNRQNELFEKLFKYLKLNTDYYPAIPFNHLVKRLKYNYFSSSSPQLDQRIEYDYDINITNLIENNLSILRGKLEAFYVAKNKISPKDAKLIYSSFSDITKDIISSGEVHGGFYPYLHQYKTTLTRDLFYAKYYSIMKYLFQQFKQGISADIKL